MSILLFADCPTSKLKDCGRFSLFGVIGYTAGGMIMDVMDDGDDRNGSS